MPCADLLSGECFPETKKKECCNVCWGYSTFLDYAQVTWTGMMIDPRQDIADTNGCARGCSPCVQGALGGMSTAGRIHGTRWMKAHESVIDENDAIVVALRANRLANGMVGDLRSMNRARNPMRVLRVSKRISFLRGVCFENPRVGEEIPFDDNGDGGGNREGFGTDPEAYYGPANPSSPTQWDACNCDVQPSTGSPCGSMSGVGSFNPVPGKFRDDFFFPSTNYSKPFFCRKLLLTRINEPGRKSQIVDAAVDELMSPIIWSTGRCGINFFSHCGGRGINNEEGCYEYKEEEPDASPWLDGEDHQQWNQLYLDLSNATFGYDRDNEGPGPNLLAQDEPTRDFKTRMIQTLPDLPNVEESGVGHPFVQMDYKSPRTNGRDIDHWERAYNPLANPTFESFAPAFGLRKCRLRKTGAAVTVVPFVVYGKVEMNFQLIHEDHTPLGTPIQEDMQEFYPHCRFHIVIQMGYRAIPAWAEEDAPRLKNSYLPEGHDDFIPGWTALEILNYDDPEYPHEEDDQGSLYPRAGHNLPPIIRAVGDTDDNLRGRQPDRILYIDDDAREFDPPSRIDWWGFMGIHASRPSQDVWQAAPGSEILPNCWDMNTRMDDIRIGGWPMIFQTVEWEKEHLPELPPGDNAQIYSGFVKLNFSTHAGQRRGEAA